MKSDKTKLMPTWLANVILTALSFVEKKLLQAKGLPELVISAMTIQLRPVRLTIQKISDKDPDNAEQVKEIWADHLGTTMVNFGNEITEGPILKIKNDAIREPLHYLAPKVFHMGRLFTDSDPDNVTQLEQHWGAVIKDDEFQEIVLSYLLAPSLEKVLDPTMVAFVLEIINTGLEQWLEQSQGETVSKSATMPIGINPARVINIKKRLEAVLKENKVAAA